MCCLPANGSPGWGRTAAATNGSSTCCRWHRLGSVGKSRCLPRCAPARETRSFYPIAVGRLCCTVCSVAGAAFPVLSGDEVGCRPVTSTSSARTGLEQRQAVGGCRKAGGLEQQTCFISSVVSSRKLTWVTEAGGILWLLALNYLVVPTASKSCADVFSEQLLLGRKHCWAVRRLGPALILLQIFSTK